MNKNIGKALFVTACVVIAAVLIMFIIELDGGDSSGYFPIFWVALIPIFTATKRRKDQEAAEKAKREKAKRVPHGMDMYSMIDRVVGDLDDDEMDYLERRLDEVHGSEFAAG